MFFLKKTLLTTLAVALFLCAATSNSFAKNTTLSTEKNTTNQKIAANTQNATPTSKNKNAGIQIDFKKENNWQELQKGLYYLKLSGPINPKKSSTSATNTNILPHDSTNRTASIDVLRFDPALFTFSVYSASWHDKKSKNMEEWLQAEKLVAAINASMFLPDNLTSNAYLRKKNAYNNKRIGTQLGAFFVADPIILPKSLRKNKNVDIRTIPTVAIVYRDDPNLKRFYPLLAMQNPKLKSEDITWQQVIDSYNVVVQNFKLFDYISNTKVLPKEPANPKWKSSNIHSIAAIGEDIKGNILFLHATNPLSITQFIRIIEYNPLLRLKRALYTEGGRQASMSIATKDQIHHWIGTNPLSLFMQSQYILPNIIGVKEK